MNTLRIASVTALVLATLLRASSRSIAGTSGPAAWDFFGEA